MDDYVDSFLPSSSWPDMNAFAKPYGGGEKRPSITMTPSSMENVEDGNPNRHDGNSSVFIDANLKYGISKGLFLGEKLSQHELQNHTTFPSQHNKTHDDSFSFQGMIKSNSASGSFDLQLNRSCSVALSHNSLTMSSSIGSSGSEPSAFPSSLGDVHSISSVPTMWPQSCSDVSFMKQGKLQGFGFQGVGSGADILGKPSLGQGKLQGFGFQGVGSGTDILRKPSLGNGNYPQLDNLPGTSLHDHNELHNSRFSTFTGGRQQKKLTSDGFQHYLQEKNDLHNLHLPYFSDGPQMTSSKIALVQIPQQLSQSTQGNIIKRNNSSGNQSHLARANDSACNGVVKPRVRARRGQATDPHSIAERLRREKISERMKNLQELVPNSNKLDKASMLDEIVDYVKFLQLQVKVLSMSRLGAAGAVVPLTTDVQAEVSRSLVLSSSVRQRAVDLSESQDDSALEEEVVKLMESNIATAMQHLQIKGLCLMPIALATATSNQKGPSAARTSP